MSKSELIATAIAMHALKAHAGRECDRSILKDGKSYDGVQLSVRGNVGKQPVRFSFGGKLTVGKPNPTGSTKRPTTDALLASVLSYLPKTKLKQLAIDVEAGKLPEPAEAHLEVGKAIIQRLSTKKPRAGIVSFIEDQKS